MLRGKCLEIQSDMDIIDDAGNELERGLKKIGRDDVIDNCIYNVEEVTDEVEQAVANFELEQTGTGPFVRGTCRERKLM